MAKAVEVILLVKVSFTLDGAEQGFGDVPVFFEA